MNKIIQFLLISVLGINVATAANLVTMREGGGQKYQIDKDSIEKKGQYDQVKLVVDYASNQKMKSPLKGVVTYNQMETILVLNCKNNSKAHERFTVYLNGKAVETIPGEKSLNFEADDSGMVEFICSKYL
ncbi:surface-adhesin E family protein [Acinetobacter baumannii]|jgi:hypothetical protein|uniref:surface-adhesin E family protein n=1 Tax=Acinetobacter baumannii TaxID=470 RepID=UPI0015B95BFF|nr:hypothetical protein [Acinetobacter sp. SwsAc7]